MANSWKFMQCTLPLAHAIVLAGVMPGWMQDNAHASIVIPEVVNADPGSTLEGLAFDALRSDPDGTCSAGMRALFRVYNGGYLYNESDHRFVASLRMYEELIAEGWDGEGVALCVPE